MVDIFWAQCLPTPGNQPGCMAFPICNRQLLKDNSPSPECHEEFSRDFEDQFFPGYLQKHKSQAYKSHKIHLVSLFLQKHDIMCSKTTQLVSDKTKIECGVFTTIAMLLIPLTHAEDYRLLNWNSSLQPSDAFPLNMRIACVVC